MVSFNEEQKMLRETIRRLCREKIAGRAAQADETGEYPWDIHRLFVENGLLRVRVPAECGGVPMDYTSVCILVEELARVDGACAITITHHQAGLGSFLKGADKNQRERYLPRMGQGDFLVGFALTGRVLSRGRTVPQERRRKPLFIWLPGPAHRAFPPPRRRRDLACMRSNIPGKACRNSPMGDDSPLACYDARRRALPVLFHNPDSPRSGTPPDIAHAIAPENAGTTAGFSSV